MRSSSLIPAVNKLGTMGLILNGSDELKKQVLPVARAPARRWRRTRCRSGRPAATPRPCAPAPAPTATTGFSTAPRLDHQRRQVDLVHGDGRRPIPDKGANGISAFMVHKDDEGFTVGPEGEASSASRARRPPSCTSRTAASPATGSSASRAPGSRPRCETLDHTRPTIGAQAVGIAQGALDAAIAYTKDRKQFGKPISDFQGVQFMLADMAMKVEAARLMVYTAAARAERGEPALGFISVGVEVLRLRRGDGGHHRRRAAVRRRRLHPATSRSSG